MPRQLSGIDAAFLDAESNTTHLHGVGILRIRGGEHPLTAEALAGHLERRLHRIEAFRRRLVTVPGGLDQPYWFLTRPNLSDHLHHRRLPPGAGLAGFEELCARITEKNLDRSRPLWEIWLVDGLPDGEQAVVFKLHHSVSDGVGSLAIVSELLDLGPEPEAEPEGAAAPGELEEESDPSVAWLLAGAARRSLHWPIDLARTMADAGSALVKLSGLTRRGPEGHDMAVPMRAPRVGMSAMVSPHRSVAMRDIPLSEVKHVAHAVGGHVNDVVLATVAGALRLWLPSHGGVPEQALVAAVPVSLRSIEEIGEPGNHVSACFVHMATHVDDPLERLRVAADAATGAKTAHAALGDHTFEHLAALASPLVVGSGLRAYTRLGLPELHPPAVNLVVSNVHGPPWPFFFAGHELTRMCAIGPIFDGTPLNVTAVSYTDHLTIAYVACPKAFPDLEELADFQRPAFDELVDAAMTAYPGG